MKRLLFLFVAATSVACPRTEQGAPPGIEATPRAEAGERAPLAEVTNQSPPLGVKVLDVRRVAADTVRVELMVTNRAPASAQATETAAVDAAIAAFAGLSLVSRDGQRRFFPLHDLTGRMSWSGLEPPAPGQRRQFWALFPVPAGEAPFVTVVVPGLKPMREVPVS